MATFYGTAGKRKGSVGGETYSVRKGKGVVKAKAVEVSNPRTVAQVLQRAHFGTSVQFYKHMTANLFKFAYEDRKENETDYNAFMRHNANVGILASQEMYTQKNPNSPFDAAPALGNFKVADGSLKPINVDISGTDWHIVDITASASDTTVGQLSSKLIANGFSAGDIVTLCVFKSNASSLSTVAITKSSGTKVPGFEFGDDLEDNPGWYVNQFVIDSDSTQLLSTVGIGASTEGHYNFGSFDSEEISAAFILVSRNTDGGLLVSTQYVSWNNPGTTAMAVAATESFKEAVLSSWGAQEAILEGSLA